MYKLVHCDVFSKSQGKFYHETTAAINRAYNFFDDRISNNKAFTQPHDFQHFFNDFMVCDVKTKQTKQLLTVTIRDLQKGKCYRKTILEFIEV